MVDSHMSINCTRTETYPNEFSYRATQIQLDIIGISHTHVHIVHVILSSHYMISTHVYYTGRLHVQNPRFVLVCHFSSSYNPMIRVCGGYDFFCAQNAKNEDNQGAIFDSIRTHTHSCQPKSFVATLILDMVQIQRIRTGR